MQKEDAFKAYDIRGTYPDVVNETIAYQFGRCFVRWSKSKQVYVGQDCRTSSPSLTSALIDGILSQGANVVDLGLVSTPMLYLASVKADALMVTASHLPRAYNGIKVMRKGAKAISEKNGLLKIRVLMNTKHPKRNRGSYIRKSILSTYVKHVTKFIESVPHLHVVIDCSNGMGGLTIPELLKELPLKVTPLFFHLDGTFPHHDPNPASKEALADCEHMVQLKTADLGVVFDADMDRVAFIDHHGWAIPADIMLALMASYELKKHPHRAVVVDTRSSMAVADSVKAEKGILVHGKVGHSIMTATMQRHKAIIGGELSGHFYFKENHYVESADIAFVKVLNILGATKLPLASLVAPFWKYANSGEINIKVIDKTRAIKAVKKAFSDGKQETVDGLTVRYSDAWLNIRGSNTEPVVRVVVEARTKKRMEELREKIERIVR